MKRFASLLAAVLLCACWILPASADEMSGGDWRVTFTADARMDETYKPNQISDQIGSMEPGDTVSFQIALKNEHAESTEWYMSNEVLQSLEKTVGATLAEGGAYTYRLSYTGPNGEQRMLFDSDTVGGTGISAGVEDAAGEGLEAATSSLEDYFFLDTLASGQGARIDLTVVLDGETQGNYYQDTFARLQMQFAVELTQPERRVRRFQSVRTGDDEQLLVWSFVMLACGLAALVLAVWQYRRGRKERKHG